MRVPPEQLSVQFGSYPDGGRGNPASRSSGDKGSPWADRANLWAATRSESRAGSESTVVTPTCRMRREGRSIARKQPTGALAVVAGVLGSGTQGRYSDATWEARNGCGVATCNGTVGCRSGRDSERPIVPRRPGNAGGGKGPHFRRNGRGRVPDCPSCDGLGWSFGRILRARREIVVEHIDNMYAKFNAARTST